MLRDYVTLNRTFTTREPYSTRTRSQGQLVASSWEACLRNLQTSPVLFEGTEILNASDRPSSCGQNVLGVNPVETGLPLLQTLTSQPSNAGVGSNDGMVQGTGMDIDM